MTLEQIEAVKKIIQEHMAVLQELTAGSIINIPRELVEKLNLPKEITDLITTSFVYGKINPIAGRLTGEISDEELDELLKTVKLSPNQINALEYAKAKAGQYITKLAEDMKCQVVDAIVTSEMTHLQGVRAAVSHAILNDKVRYAVVQTCRDMTLDFKRDWHRVAHTEMWNAKIDGEVMAVMENDSFFGNEDGEVIVYKRPSPNACNQCKRLYLDVNGNPKLFKLSEMIAFGTNVGLKADEWKPVKGTMHPNCYCTFNVMPAGFGFDKDGRVVFKDKAVKDR